MDTHSSPKSLASIAQTISKSFALASHISQEQDQENQPRCFKLTNQAQRFELWAKNLGLYHLGHSSLDYRFRDAPSISEYTFGLLRDLGRLLEQFGSATLGHEAKSSMDTGSAIDATAVVREESSDDSEEEDFESSDGEDDESVIDLLLGSIAGTIDKLYRLSFKIRNPAMRLGFSRSVKYHEIDPETGVDLIEQLRENDRRHIEQLFGFYRSTSPDKVENDFLVRRLAKANTRRRQQFKHWKKRRSQFDTLPKADERQPGTAVLKTPSRPSTATFLDLSKVNLDDSLSIVSSSTMAITKDEEKGDSFSIPPPPNYLWEKDEFECPYCFTLCPRKLLNQTNWQTHILRDLRPYICTYENCKDADKQYDSLRDWISHEAVIHRSKPVTESRNEDSGSPESRTCPFCYEDAEPHHIATHLRRVACFSLPRFIGEDEVSVEGSEMSNKAEMRSKDSMISEASYASSVDETGSASETEDGDLNRTTSTPFESSEVTLGGLKRFREEVLVQRTLDARGNIGNARDEAIARLETLILDDQEKRMAAATLEEITQVVLDNQNANYTRINAESQAAQAVTKEEVPAEQEKSIKFIDCVGRKFRFPFELVHEWRGMEDLINEAFLDFKAIRSHVAEVHYDLVDQNGGIIIPQHWERVIKPGMQIRMYMWPIPEKPIEPEPSTTDNISQSKLPDRGNVKKPTEPADGQPRSFASWMMGGPKRKPMPKLSKELSESREVIPDGSENYDQDEFDIPKGP
ncbi:unnamed protein product [Penicillium pancosmium]